MLDKFQAEAEAAGAVVKRCKSLTAATAHVQNRWNGKRMLTTELPAEIRSALPLTSFTITDDAAHAHLCLSYAMAGIAATGSVLIDISDPRERSYTALPPVHVVFINSSSIVADIYALHDLLYEYLGSAKAAYLSLTTGPSRTADIERVLTIGVHGPGELHLLVLEGE